MGVMDSNKELFLTQHRFLQEVLEAKFSMGCIIGEIGHDLESDLQSSLLKDLKKYYLRKKS